VCGGLATSMLGRSDGCVLLESRLIVVKRCSSLRPDVYGYDE